MKIREAIQDDADAIRRVYLAAFPENERDLVAGVAVKMLSEAATLPVLSLVASAHGSIIGHVAFSPVTARDTIEPLGYILAPQAVSPAHQKRGIASRLIQTGIQQVSAGGSGVLLVYGDPDFYGRFGFSADRGECYTPPYPLQYPFGWQVMALGDLDFPSSSIPISCVPSLTDPALW